MEKRVVHNKAYHPFQVKSNEFPKELSSRFGRLLQGSDP